MTFVYIILAILLVSGGVSTCNYVGRVNAESRTETCIAESATQARVLAEANLAATEENDRKVRELEHRAAEQRKSLDVKITKLREDLARANKRKPVPKECVAACNEHFAPVADALRGLRSLESGDHDRQGTPRP